MNPRSDREAIAALIARYLAAYEAHDAEACADLYTEDALVVSPWGPPARGRLAIAAEHLAWFEAGETDKVMTVEHVETAGNLASAKCISPRMPRLQTVKRRRLRVPA